MAEETLAAAVNNQQMADELNALIRLDYDAIAAYELAIEQLESAEFKQKLGEFRDDHVRHTQNLADLIRWMGAAPVKAGDAMQMMTKAKVHLVNLRGDKGILQAMKSNEDNTNAGYEKAIRNLRASQDMADVLRENLEDERRHRAWLEETLAGL